MDELELETVLLNALVPTPNPQPYNLNSLTISPSPSPSPSPSLSSLSPQPSVLADPQRLALNSQLSTLYQVPASIVTRLLSGEALIADSYEKATVKDR